MSKPKVGTVPTYLTLGALQNPILNFLRGLSIAACLLACGSGDAGFCELRRGCDAVVEGCSWGGESGCEGISDGMVLVGFCVVVVGGLIGSCLAYSSREWESDR